MELPFGKKVSCGNYYVLKHTRSLSGKELDRLRKAQGIPDGLRKYLTRGTLPVITVSTVTDSWRIEFSAGLNVFEAIDKLPVAVDGDGHYTYYGESRNVLGNIINGWFAYTSTSGDDRYMADVIKAMQDYLARASEAGGEPLSEEESEKMMEEDGKDEEARTALAEMPAESGK